MIRVGDIFLKQSKDFDGKPRYHYYYCIYAQHNDENNTLNEDIIGLLITTNKKMATIVNDKNDYNVTINLHDKTAYVCCDKIFRFKENEVKQNKGNALSSNEKKEIFKYYIKFLKETTRQLRKEHEYAEAYNHID